MTQNNEYWDKLHGLYADARTGVGQSMNPAQQGPQAEQGMQSARGYEHGGLVENPAENMSYARIVEFLKQYGPQDLFRDAVSGNTTARTSSDRIRTRGSYQPPDDPGPNDRRPIRRFEHGGLVDDSEGWSGSGALGSMDLLRATPATSTPWYMQAAQGFLGSLVPAAGAAATGLLIDRMFPGTPGKARAVDMRQPEMQRGAGMAESRLANLQRNPNSFGLPGDPEDPNTPAGRRLYQIRKNARSASAATGALETGGHAQRESDAVNAAIGNEYNQIQNQGFQNLGQMTPQLQFQQEAPQTSPWSKILTSALAPGIKGGLQSATDAAMKKWFI